MNILFVSHTGRNPGGAQNVLFSLLEFLKKEGFNCHCVFPEGGPFLESVRNLGVQPHIVKFKWWAGFDKDTFYKITDCLLNFRLSIDPVVKIIQDHKIDLVISNTITMAEGALAARVAGVPHIWYIHEILSRDPKIIHMLRLDFLYLNVEMMSEVMVVVSNEIKKEIEDHIGRSSPKIRVIYNGVKQEPKDFVRLHNKKVISVGGVCYRKGQMILLKAFKFVHDEIPDARFYTAGKFWEKQYMRDIGVERVRLGLEGKFHFVKWMEDIKTFYREGSVFASGAICEPFGLSLLEAMNNGLPVVSTDSGGPSEIVVPGETGYLVPVDDEVALADKIIYLLKNDEIGDQMGIKGYNRVQSNFSHEAFVSQFLNVIRKVA